MTHPSPATVTDRYLVVGPSTVLEGEAGAGDGTLTLAAAGPRGRIGTLRCDAGSQRAVIACDPGLLGHDVAAAVETLRLFVRVVAKRFGAGAACLALEPGLAWPPAVLERLRQDGFAPEGPGGQWVSTRLAYERPAGQQAEDMDGVYADPLTIPWNFVPVETDVLDRLARELPPPARLLDLGCGFGKNARELARRGYEVAGVDVAERAVLRARELLGTPEGFAVAAADDLPWPGGTFDAVLDVGCLHCTPAATRPASLREAARVLRPAGVLCSRIFRPRPARWLAAQPFRTSGFGMEEGDAVALFATAFADVDVEATADVLYLTARAPRR